MFTKKTLNFLFLSTLILFSVCVITAVAIGQRGRDLGKPAQLKVELIIYKNQYLLREPIWVKMKVTNIGKEEGWFYFCTRSCLEIKDSKGKVYPSQVSSSLSAITIKAGETLEYELNLLGCFGIPEGKFKIYYYLPPETYTISYHLNKDVKSETYKFEILKPEGDELRAMNLLKEAYNLIEEKKWDERQKTLSEIIEKYPQSVYSPYVFLRRGSDYSIHYRNYDSALNNYYELITTYPSSREAVHAVNYISAIYENQKDKKGYIDAMNGLIEKYTDTDISKEAEKQLKNLKEEDFK